MSHIDSRAVNASPIVAEIPHTRAPGRQYHDDVLTAVATRVVAATVAELADFLIDRTDKSWPAALERAERKTLRILQENKP